MVLAKPGEKVVAIQAAAHSQKINARSNYGKNATFCNLLSKTLTVVCAVWGKSLTLMLVPAGAMAIGRAV